MINFDKENYKPRIIDPIIEQDDSSISKNTLNKYLEAFERMFLLNNQEPFSSNIRSSLRVKQMEKDIFAIHLLLLLF